MDWRIKFYFTWFIETWSKSQRITKYFSLQEETLNLYFYTPSAQVLLNIKFILIHTDFFLKYLQYVIINIIIYLFVLYSCSICLLLTYFTYYFCIYTHNMSSLRITLLLYYLLLIYYCYLFVWCIFSTHSYFNFCIFMTFLYDYWLLFYCIRIYYRALILLLISMLLIIYLI